MDRHHTKTVADLFRTGENGQAAAYLDCLHVRDFSAEPELLIWRGRVLSALRNWEECATAWREALRVHPGHGEAMLKLGKALFEIAEFNAVIDVLEPCLSRTELWENAALLTARSLTKLKRYDRAIPIWRQFAERRLRSPEGERQWLWCAVAAMRFEEAAMALRHAVNGNVDLSGLEHEAMLAIWESASTQPHPSLGSILGSMVSPHFGRPNSNKLVATVALYKEDRFSAAEDLFPADDPALPKPLVEFAQWCRLRSMLKTPGKSAGVLSQAVAQTSVGQLSVNHLAGILIQIWNTSLEQHRNFDHPGNLARLLAPLRDKLAPLINRLNLCHFPEISLSIWQAARVELPVSQHLKAAVAKAHNAIGEFDTAAKLLSGEDGGKSLDAANFKLMITSLINAGQFAPALQLLDAASPWEEFSKTNPKIWFEIQYLKCTLCTEQRDWPALVACANALISSNSSHKDGYLQLATARTSMLHLHEAESAYILALRLEPENISIAVNLGTIYRMLSNTSKARECYLKALRLGCNNPNQLLIIGEFIKSAGDESGLHNFLSAIDGSPATDIARLLARVTVLLSLGAVAEIVALVEADPESCMRDPLLACAAARAYRGLNLCEKALAVVEPHVRRRSQFSHVALEYFDTLILLGQFDAAQQFLETFPQMLASRRGRLLTCTRRMDLYCNVNKLQLAWQCFDDLSYVSALQSPNSKLPFVRAGAGTSLVDGDGLTLICAVQGVGDEIRLASLYNEIIPRFSSLAFTCDPRLRKLFQRSFPGCQFLPSVRRDQSLMSLDMLPYYAGLPDMELSRVMDFDTYKLAAQADRVYLVNDMLKVLRRDRANFEPGRPYLVSDPTMSAGVRSRLQGIGSGRKVGIAWQSGNRSAARMMHYSSPEAWEEIFSLPGVDFISFQYGDCEAQIRAAELKYGVKIHRLEDVDLKNDFETVASIISQLDAAIGPVVSFTELCAALGTPTAFMWRVPGGKWRQRPRNGGDIWHSCGVPVLVDPPDDCRGLVAATARQLQRWLGV